MHDESMEKNTARPLAVVLFGSPKRYGFTAQLLGGFLQELGDAYDVHLIDAYEKSMKPCVGCGFCERQIGCCFEDFHELDRLLRAAQLLIVASPIYNLSFPAPLKAIFDRMQPYFSARFVHGIRPPIAQHKRAAMLLTCGSNDDAGVDLIRRQLKMIFTVINATLEQEVVWKNTDHSGDMTPLKEQLKKAARALRA